MKSLIIIVLTLCICGCKGAYKQEEVVLWEGQKIAMPKEYRQITGYDSIQVIHYTKGSPLGNGGGGWEGHFCYPKSIFLPSDTVTLPPSPDEGLTPTNKKVTSITFKYDSIMIINFDSSEVK